jgi:cyclopropane-fatty-acyl-phospholipid synthase
VNTDAELASSGTSSAAIQHHYDLSNHFFAQWLGPELVYSCALWDESNPADTLAAAQRRKLDWFATNLDVGGKRIIDIGCGWGGLLDRFVRHHGAVGGVGLTLSPAQRDHAIGRAVPGVEFRVESWVHHRPVQLYDAATCIEMSEHLAHDQLSVDEKVDVYRSFFERVADLLTEDGRFGLQLICLDNLGHAASRHGLTPTANLILDDIFPESMPGSLGELATGWETHFQLHRFEVHPEHYRRTFRSWGSAARAHADVIRAEVGSDVARTFTRYFAAGEALFRLREHTLYRAVLRKRSAPKVWARPLRPGRLSVPEATASIDATASASTSAVRAHYDVANEFYALWLGPSMMYTSGWWEPEDPGASLEQALANKHHHFAQAIGGVEDRRVLDVGCGWGGTLRYLVEHGAEAAVGLTLSEAQRMWIEAAKPLRADVRLESWTEHDPAQPYDAIVSFGAFEHFARDGSSSQERVETYRMFFARMHSWLEPRGMLALETIAHDDAPDTASTKGRGPLGDLVLDLFPESICPHTCEVILGLEPYFEVELLRSDAADFARTFRQWLLALRANEAQATNIVGEDVVRQYRRYLVSSESQFRMRALTNVRLALRRRDQLRR